MPVDDQLSTSEVAKILRVHRATVHRIPEYLLPYSEVGRRRRRRYLASDVSMYQKRSATLPLTELTSDIDQQRRQLTDHEHRLRALEAGAPKEAAG